MAKSMDHTILTNLIKNLEYTRKVLPFLKSDYFLNESEKVLFNEINDFFTKYNALPNAEVLDIQLQALKGISTTAFKEANDFISTLNEEYETPDYNWLVKNTEKFCLDKSVLNAVMAAISIIDGNDKNRTQDAIPGILSDALAVSFNKSIGHDYFSDIELRYDKYFETTERLPFDIDLLNLITRGGLPPKTLTLFLGGTGTGKTHIKCHLATSYIKQGKNVLYITNEMAEERIAERIDANLLNINIDQIENMGKENFVNRLTKIAEKTHGKLVIKEYPSNSAHSGHFKALIDELRIKKNFMPDVVLVDYLGICASARYKNSTGINTNTYYGSVAEELRAIGQYYNIPVISSIQTNRSGSANSELGLTDIADSFSINMAADLVVGLVNNEELASLNQLMFFVLKNRFNDINFKRKFVVGVDRTKMRLYNSDSQFNSNEYDEPEEPQYIPPTRQERKRDYSGFTI